MVEQKKLAFVDALRGIAVLGVVMAHVQMPKALVPLNTIGGYGVQLFFVVSAFTLFLSLHVKFHTESHPVTNFFIRRFFRIAPAFYLAAAFYLVKDGLGPTFWAPDGIHAWQIISTLLFLHGWHPESINTVVPGGWSIAVEMTFYLFVPVCFLRVKDPIQALFLSFALLVAGVIIGRFLLPSLVSAYPQSDGALAGYFVQLWFFSQACVFPLGFIFFYLFRDQIGAQRITKITAAGFIAISIYICGALSKGGFLLLPLHFLYGLAFVLFGYAVALHPFRIIVNPLICYIGKLSFSVYLFHFWAISLLTTYLEPLLTPVGPYLSAGLFYFCAVVLSCIFATVTFYCVEQPGQAIGRSIIRRLEANAVR